MSEEIEFVNSLNRGNEEVARHGPAQVVVLSELFHVEAITTTRMEVVNVSWLLVYQLNIAMSKVAVRRSRSHIVVQDITLGHGMSRNIAYQPMKILLSRRINVIGIGRLIRIKHRHRVKTPLVGRPRAPWQNGLRRVDLIAKVRLATTLELDLHDLIRWPRNQVRHNQLLTKSRRDLRTIVLRIHLIKSRTKSINHGANNQISGKISKFQNLQAQKSARYELPPEFPLASL